MKTTRYLIFFVVLLLLFGSCELPQDGDNGTGSSNIVKPPNVPPRKFWAQDLVTEKFYQIEAEFLAENANCKVWAEKGSGVSVEMAASVARAYEEFLPKMLNAFAYEGPIADGGIVVGYNTMQLADYMGDGDGKLCILLLDIVDGYKPGVNDSYCPGYFWAGNLFSADDSRDTSLRYSNECDMIYLDTDPATPGSMDSNSTFAHEMQHMMSFTNTFITGRYPNTLDVWIDEGLSSAAEWLYYGTHSSNRVGYYVQDTSGLIQLGNNFFVWGNRSNENQYALLDDYATVYLFFQWLRLQTGSNDIYYNITLADDYDYRAVTSAANWAMPGRGYNDWGTLLKTWHAANYINAPSGPYGYMNDAILKDIRARTVPAGIKTLSLAPGEGVYSITNGFSLPANASYINYAGLNRDGIALSDSKTFSGGALLTYNSNSDNRASTMSGLTTGVASTVAAKMGIPYDGGLPEARLSGPFAIGAGDILRRNGYEVPYAELGKFDKGILKRGFEN